jgi:hypothetical protein
MGRMEKGIRQVKGEFGTSDIGEQVPMKERFVQL